MNMLDRNNVLSTLPGAGPIELELGCGPKKRNSSALGIDVLDYPNVDFVGDVYEVLAAFPAGSVDAVAAHHFIEHVTDLPKLLDELARILKPGARIEFTVPHFSNPYFYSDPTHRSFFGLYTFCYLANGSPFKRQVPTYGANPVFTIQQVTLGFASAPQFIFRRMIKRLGGLIFDSSNYMRELYEENFCYLFPCYEVRYVLRRDP